MASGLARQFSRLATHLTERREREDVAVGSVNQATLSSPGMASRCSGSVKLTRVDPVPMTNIGARRGNGTNAT